MDSVCSRNEAEGASYPGQMVLSVVVGIIVRQDVEDF